MKSFEFVALLIVCLNKLAAVCNKSYTLAYLFQHAKVKIGNDVLPLNNAESWKAIPVEKMHTINNDQWAKDSIFEVLPLKVNVMFCAIVNAKINDRVKIAKAFMPKANDAMLKNVIALAVANNAVMHYDKMQAKEKTVKAAKATTTAKTY
jgi:hypothetical protein